MTADEPILRHGYRDRRILIAGRQPATRSALEMLLQEEDGLKVVGKAVDINDLLRQVGPTCPDVVVLDWDLPGAPIQTLLASLRDLGYHAYVVVLSGRSEDEKDALASGADAFVSKANPPRQLVKVILNLDSRKDHE